MPGGAPSPGGPGRRARSAERARGTPPGPREPRIAARPSGPNGARLLLVSVFGPYGVRNAYDVGDGMQMEVLDNQLTREQGIHSPRVRGSLSYGLYLMAQNISVPTVVLDFPRWGDFVRELQRGYTHVGISFICQNILKARRMAEHIRQNHPQTTIILGGGGADIPALERSVPCDEICHGEGIRWLQRYFGEDSTGPVRGCILSCPQTYYVYGYRARGISSSVIPGVGCPNGCDFCCTTHKFGRRYIPFITSGKQMFDLLLQEEHRLGVQSFKVTADNFLKERVLAEELLAEMEAHGKPYSFYALTSAETIADLGVDFLVRLGVNQVWIGVESKHSRLAKLRNIDLREMVRSLRANGVSVIGSAVLFQDHHDHDTLLEDIEWVIGLGADLAQFLALSPCPGTPLFERLRAQGRLSDDYPYHLQNGLDRLCHQHPHFLPRRTRDYIDHAYRRNFEVNGPGILNLVLTAIAGYRKVRDDVSRRERDGLAWDRERLAYVRASSGYEPDLFMRARLQKMRESALRYRPLVLTMTALAPDRAARATCTRVAELYAEAFGAPTVADEARSAALFGRAALEWARIRARSVLGMGKVTYQPPTIRREYNMGGPA